MFFNGYANIPTMKKLFLFLILAIFAYAGELEWADSYKAGLAQAKKEGKNIYLLVTSEDCRWCRKFESTTLLNDEVINRIQAKFVPVHVTRGKDDYPSFIKAKMVPMHFFLKSEGRVFHTMPGYWNVEDFLSILNDTRYKLKGIDK